MMHSGALAQKIPGYEASTLSSSVQETTRITLELSPPIMYCLS